MDIYYKRVKVYGKWPENDELIIDEVHFSTSKNSFEGSVFLKTEPSNPPTTRKKLCGKVLKIKPYKINLISI